MINFPNIDPVIFSLGFFSVRWYSLAYILGVVIGSFYIKKINQKHSIILGMNPFDDILVYVVMGIILGGRLGYVLFYNLDFYIHNPLKVLYLWQGGMSFHGGCIGVIIATLLYSRVYKNSFLKLMDMLACATPIGLFFGRIANFINGELYGRVTDVPWAVVFPSPASGYLPRHPSQLYEAFLEGFVLFLILGCFSWFTKIHQKPGVLSGIFLCGYSLSRIIVENFRQPDLQVGFIFDFLTLGQILSLPMLILGIGLIFVFVKKVSVDNGV